ncbi:TetR/AcrR family transcriptional regulator [Ramlibacter sp. AN1015]|uniref:TetR/AcrR family transcriptional regulator n=1 Tax=Ramlibacter sp. AN1015 TaxID=3133428 RepID=UPI0030BD7810
MAPEASTSRRSRDEIQEAIRQAGIAEFALHGLRGATTQAIAERAGLSKAQLHYYIDSKEALYAELLQHVVDEWSRDTFGDAGADPADVIAGYVRKKLDFSFDYPALSKLFANELISGGEVLRGMLSRPRSRAGQAVETLQQWIDQGRLRPLDPLLLMMHIWSVTQHYADFDVQVRYMLRLRAGEPLDRAHITAEVVSFVLHGCGLMPARRAGTPRQPGLRGAAGK